MSEKSPISETNKEIAVVSVTGIQPTRTTESSAAPIAKDVWHTGFWRRFPWLGVGGLIGVLVCAVMQAVVLVTSDGRNVKHWSTKVTPNVVLNIFNSLSGILFGIAITNGVAIVWWRKALKGTTIQELHNSWCFTTSFKDIFLKWRYFNAAALAALVTKLTVLDGTLFQKATSTKLVMGKSHPIPITTYPTESFPTTGYYNSTTNSLNSSNSFTGYFTNDVYTWVNSANGEISWVRGYNECIGTCFVQSPGIGFTADCTTSPKEQVDYVADIYSANADASNTLRHNLFNVALEVHSPTPAKNYAWIQLDTLHFELVEGDVNNQTQQCPGVVVRQTCELRPSIISYPVTMNYFNTTNGDSSDSSPVHVYLGQLDMDHVSYQGLQDYDPSLKQLPGYEFIKYMDIDNQENDEGENALGGILYSLTSEYQSNVQLYNKAGNSWQVATTGIFAGVELDTSNENPHGAVDGCPWGYMDPLSTVIQGLNSLMFITSNDAFNRDGINNDSDIAAVARNVTGQQFLIEVHYATDYLYILGALIVTVFCVTCVLPSYWGFWQLGRKATLSPIEIANAFQAPVLADAHHRNGHAEEILKTAGRNRVHYTEFMDEETGASYRIVGRNV